MIHYALKCAEGHRFESWFQSASAFDTLRAAGHLACAVCGSGAVEKALMAPRLGSGDEGQAEPAKKPGALSEPRTEAEAALASLRDRLERETDYVGRDFARQARAMHDGGAPRRAIWGEARRDETKALIEDGVPILPLPVIPKSGTN